MTKILVRAEGGISANSNHEWTVAAGARSAAAQVSVIDGGSYWQIDNTLTAVRIPKTITITTAGQLVDSNGDAVPVGQTPPDDCIRIYAPAQVLAPIQGIRHRDGTWTGTGPNYLNHGPQYCSTQVPDNWNYTVWGNGNYPATSATVTVLEDGPLRAKIKVAYVAVTQMWYNSNPYTVCRAATKDGYYNCTVWLEAGQPIVFIHQDTQGAPSWCIDMNIGVDADRARYRGHHATTIANGHNQDGTIYNNSQVADRDAEINLSDSGAGHRINQDYTQQISYSTLPAWDGVWFSRLYAWYTWEPDTGYYWFAFDSAGASDSNMWGIFQGDNDSYSGGGHLVGMYGKPATSTPTEVGLYSCTRPWQEWVEGYIHRENTFGIFLGVKGDDVPSDFTSYDDSYQAQQTGGSYSLYNPTIQKMMNLHSGAGQIWKQIDQTFDFPDPPGGFGGMFLNRTDTEAFINAIMDDYPGGFYAYLYSADPPYRRLWSAIADETNADASELVDYCINGIYVPLLVYTNIGSIYSLWWFYWMAGTRFMETAVHTQAMLSLDQVRPFLTSDQKRSLKTGLSMIGHLFWDNDFWPYTNWAYNFALGTGNMPIQMSEMMREITVLLKDHPQFSARFSTVLSDTVSIFAAMINDSGAPHECPHYAGATIVPTTDCLRQLQVAGYDDMFAPTSSIHNKLSALAEWTMQIMTPKQARFSNLRKMVPFGDSLSESHDHFLSLIMGFEAHDLTLSKRMAGAWAEMGQTMSSFYASSALKIRPYFSTQDPALGDADFPGYMTVMRSGWATANESAVFMLHGEWGNDHCKPAQRGSPAIYLLGAPMSIPYGVMYEVTLNSSWVGGNLYTPVSQLTGTWNTITDLNPAFGLFDNWYSDTYTYTPTTDRVDLTCNFSICGWVRQMTYYRDVISQPIVRLRDSNTDSGDSIFSLHNMAEGTVTLPDNSTFTPTTLNGTPFAVSNGACFKFTGHSVAGVSWDVYYFGPSAQAFIGMWSHTYSGYPEEKQYILRIKTAGPCDVVIIPYPTGQRPANLNVVQISGGLRVDPAARVLAN